MKYYMVLLFFFVWDNDFENLFGDSIKQIEDDSCSFIKYSLKGILLQKGRTEDYL